MRHISLLIALLVGSGMAWADCTPTSVTAGTTTATSQVITWSTSSACRSRVLYGYSDTFGSMTAEADLTGVTSHSVTVTGLKPYTTYTFAVVSRDASGNNGVFACVSSCGGIRTAAVPAGGFTMELQGEGAQQVAQGYSSLLLLNLFALTGTSEATTITVSNLPLGVSVTFPTAVGGYCSSGVSSSTSFHTVAGQFVNEGGCVYTLKFTAAADATPVTAQAVHIAATSASASYSFDWPLTVYAPTFTTGTPASYPAIPNLSDWQAHMTTYGNNWCAYESSPGTFVDVNGRGDGATCESCTMYYDGARVYAQIADYVNAHALNVSGWSYTPAQCAQNFAKMYATFVNANGRPQGFIVFPQGIYTDYLRNGTAASLTAAQYLATHPWAAKEYGGSSYLYAPAYRTIRETAYSLNSDLVGAQSGLNTATATNIDVELLLGMLDSAIRGTFTDGEQPFYDALAADALIRCYESAACANYHDARIPPMMKALADHLWSSYWLSGISAFCYNSSRCAGGEAMSTQYQGLNPLIAPLYAWVFKMTGDSTYQTNGDAIFAAGAVNVDDTVNNNGKSFSQAYRWSFDYVNWRSQPASSRKRVISGGHTLGGSRTVQ